ncbi:MAG: TetR/AcrR family transcriptional regulator [Anaerolineaceae bacterium]|nr:MAG: TetR/AcrR family transcriptional regulator [Anaerolineaceae bacterium]
MDKQRQRSEETRSRLLEAAERSFAQQGFDGTGVAKICQAAGVTKGAFYHHFSSKEDVFMELFRRWLERLEIQMAKLRENSASVPEELLSMTSLMQEVLQATEGQFPIYLEFWTRAMRDPAIRQELISPFYRYRDLFSEMVLKGVSEGTMKEVHPETTARLILAVALGLLIQGLLEPQEAEWDQVTQESMQILLDGLMKR